MLVSLLSAALQALESFLLRQALRSGDNRLFPLGSLRMSSAHGGGVASGTRGLGQVAVVAPVASLVSCQLPKFNLHPGLLPLQVEQLWSVDKLWSC